MFAELLVRAFACKCNLGHFAGCSCIVTQSSHQLKCLGRILSGDGKAQCGSKTLHQQFFITAAIGQCQVETWLVVTLSESPTILCEVVQETTVVQRGWCWQIDGTIRAIIYFNMCTRVIVLCT